MNDQEKCVLDILLDNLARTICCHYQGDEEFCDKVQDHLTCNCDGKIRDCDLWKYSREYKGETDEDSDT